MDPPVRKRELAQVPPITAQIRAVHERSQWTPPDEEVPESPVSAPWNEEVPESPVGPTWNEEVPALVDEEPIVEEEEESSELILSDPLARELLVVEEKVVPEVVVPELIVSESVVVEKEEDAQNSVAIELVVVEEEAVDFVVSEHFLVEEGEEQSFEVVPLPVIRPTLEFSEANEFAVPVVEPEIPALGWEPQPIPVWAFEPRSRDLPPAEGTPAPAIKPNEQMLESGSARSSWGMESEPEPEWLMDFATLEVLAGSLPVSDGGDDFPDGSVPLASHFCIQADTEGTEEEEVMPPAADTATSGESEL
jgi:hypothetical protein